MNSTDVYDRHSNGLIGRRTAVKSVAKSREILASKAKNE